MCDSAKNPLQKNKLDSFATLCENTFSETLRKMEILVKYVHETIDYIWWNK